MSNFIYKRILLKLSGEALADSTGSGFNMKLLEDLSNEVKTVVDKGVEVAIVIGGGNIIRGANQPWMDRVHADYMGMLATVINSMTLAEVLTKNNINAKVFSAVRMDDVCEAYNIENAIESLNAKEVAVLGGGTGKPFVTTDTTATLRAKELNCDCVLKATKVDGVYDDDPMKNRNAKKFAKISYDESLERDLKVMDEKAFQMAKENSIPIIVFNIFDNNSILKVLEGQDVGTLVS